MRSKGNRSEEERPITGIRKIELRDHVDLHIVKSKNEGVVVQAGDNLIPSIKTRKEGEHLTIKDENTCDWVRSYDENPKVTVRTQRLLRLENRSTADISMKGKIEGKRFYYEQWNGMGNVELQLHADSLWLKQHTGSADLHCSGSCDMANLFLDGHGFMYLQDLKARKIWAHSAGSGDMKLHVTQELGAKLESMGSIFFKGKGELVHSLDRGEGDIERGY